MEFGRMEMEHDFYQKQNKDLPLTRKMKFFWAGKTKINGLLIFFFYKHLVSKGVEPYQDQMQKHDWKMLHL